MLKLHEEAKWIVSHAWSFRFLVLAAALSGAEGILPLFMDHPPLPRRIFAVVVFLIIVSAMVARIIVQRRPPEFLPPSPEPAPTPAPSPATDLMNQAAAIANAATAANTAAITAQAAQ
ncbi:hypothetical protein AOQ73_05930 [Bradyrhizobium pachyrhizi]|uniref:DUF7940 domain-containing protein n=1 Tax=Bradyrhizobium pachyrhizi TaxID=280333 RepID=UPI0007054F92|nr:hypothetical protein [Bradyrhizobium pachyrhizi]KRQ11945.1 hypothetical protein AOQ73_05930 [Bradyrhizobium pachyrhizi]